MVVGPISRRNFLAASPVGAAFLGAAAKPRSAKGAPFSVCNLRTNQLFSPIGIDNQHPSLSWSFSTSAGTSVAAYRVLVASSFATLETGRADLWDTGWVAEPNPINMIYDGAPLRSRQRCHWQVLLRDSDGHIGTSDPAFWEMGLLEAADWKAQWLAAESQDERLDREQAVTWIAGAATVDTPRNFHLRFESDGGEAVFTLAVDGALKGVRLDGKALTLPAFDPNAFGGRPALRLMLPVAPGKHRLDVELAAAPGYFTKPDVAIASQLRLGHGGGARRISNGWLTETGPSGSQKVGPALAAQNQPIFPWPAAPARLFRRRFTLTAKPEGARLYVSALGGYDIWINGNRVGDAALQPDQCDFAQHIPYRVHDVTALLRDGENVVAAMVADGWFASYTAPVGRYPFTPAPRRLILQLEVGQDAGRMTVCTDEKWRTASSALRYSEIYGGEDWDFDHDAPGWDGTAFDDSGWEPVALAPEPTAPLVAKIAPPVRITRQLKPVSIIRKDADRFIVDFGQNFAGRVRLTLPRVLAGTVQVRHAELLDVKGELDQRNLRAARAEDKYRFPTNGGRVVLEPRFTYQGFRYAEVRGLADLAADQVAGLVMTSDLTETGLLKIGQPIVQKIWSNTLWSQRSNFLGAPTDCPQRDERLGWSGDAQVFWDTAAFNMDVGAFTREWLQELRAAQGPVGNYPLWAPLPKAASFGPPQSTPGWADAGVMLPYICYLHYGDRTVVDENWAAMQSYVDGVLRVNPNGLWENERGVDFGDWLSVDAKNPGDETTPKLLVATAMLVRSITQLAAMAEWTGRKAEAAKFRNAASRSRKAFSERFVQADGTVGNGSQSSYILALALDLVPVQLRKQAAAKLVIAVRDRGTALSTGFLGTPLALDALADTEHGDVAVDLLLRTEFPSWGHMALKGGTTMWERWNGDRGDIAMNSYNHYAFGAVCSFLYRRVAGISPVAPGFSEVTIAPLLDRRLGRVTGSYDSVRGRISVDIQPSQKGYLLDVAIPAGVNANIEVPIEPGHRVNISKGVTKSGQAKPFSVAFKASAGNHHFIIERAR